MAQAQQFRISSANSVGNILAEVGVEPESFSPTPRRVVPTAYIIQWRLWAINVLTGIVLFAHYVRGFVAWYDYAGIIGLASLTAGVMFIGWLSAEVSAKRSHRLLHEGYAVRAIVEHCVVSAQAADSYTVRYRYTHGKRGQRLEQTQVSVQNADRMCGFAAGTTFTVLLDPADKYAAPVPYFEVSGATIPGAAPARTTPPPMSTTPASP